MNPPLFTLALKLLETTSVQTSTEEVLWALGEGVQRAVNQMEGAQNSGDDEFAQAVTDEACEITEELLGAAFVVCQATITRVVSRVAIVRKLVEREGRKLTTALEDKSALLKIGKQVGNSGVSQVEAIDAFANYFKHESEWSSMWVGLKTNQAKTAQTVRTLGATPGSSSNLRRGAQELGNTKFSNMCVFVDIVNGWRAEVQHACEGELRALGLIN